MIAPEFFLQQMIWQGCRSSAYGRLTRDSMWIKINEGTVVLVNNSG